MKKISRSRKPKAAASNGHLSGQVTQYKSRPNKKRYTKAERERIIATRAVLEVLEHQEKLHP